MLGRTIRLLLSITLVIAVLGSPVSAQEMITPFDWCISIDHFPAEPVGGGPSKVGIYATFPLRYAGGSFEFSLSGASGDVAGSGPIDGFGIAHAYAPLFDYGTHLIVSGYVRLDGFEELVDTSAIGDGGVFVVDDAEPECDPSALTTAPPPTTTTPSTSTTSTPTTTSSTTSTSTTTTTSTTTPPASTSPPTTEATTGGESGDFPWPVFVIGLGFLSILGGILLARKEDDDDCEPLRRAWQADEDRWKRAKETLAEFREDLEKRRQKVKELETRLEAFEEATRSSITIDGLERHIMDGAQVLPEELAAETAHTRKRLETARETEADAEQTVKDWEQQVADERSKADASKAAYEECIGVSLPGVSDGGDTDGGTSAGTDGGGVDVETEGGDTVVDGGPSVATPPDEPPEEEEKCKKGDEETRPGGNSHKETFVVDFSVIVEAEEGSERKIGEAKDMAFGLNDIGNILDAAGDLLTGSGALKSAVTGLGAMKAGKYVMGAKGLAEGAAGGAMFADVIPVSVPTSPPEVLAEFLEQTAKLGGLVASKASEWLTMNELYQARVTYFQQTIIATPFEMWVCDGEKMVCKSKFWEFTVGPLSRRAGPKSKVFRLESDMAKDQMSREIRTLSGIAQREIEKSVQKRVQFDQKHRPGACDS